MPALATPVAIASAVLFAALALMSDRKRGAAVAQGAFVLACILVFVAIVVQAPVAGIPSADLAAFGIGLIAASVAGMLYHLYLGRFDSVWVARAVFTLVYLVLALVLGLVLLSQF